MATGHRIKRRGKEYHAAFSAAERAGPMNYKGYKQLQYADRLRIEGALRTGAKVADIAREIGVCKKTIYNEIKRGLCVQQREGYIFEEVYCADVAEAKYQENLRAKGPDIKLGKDHEFADFVEDMIINKRFSPGALLAFIEEQGLVFDTHICETTLYNYIYRGDVFLELNEAHLLYKGERRPAPEEKQDWANQPKGATIEDRPPEVWTRQTFGHWEMDSVMGPVGTSAALLVLTERLTRQGIVIRVPDHTAESVVRAMDRLERKMGKHFRRIFRTITVDNGTEFSDCEGMERSCRTKRRRTKILLPPVFPQRAGEQREHEPDPAAVLPQGRQF